MSFVIWNFNFLIKLKISCTNNAQRKFRAYDIVSTLSGTGNMKQIIFSEWKKSITHKSK